MCYVLLCVCSLGVVAATGVCVGGGRASHLLISLSVTARLSGLFSDGQAAVWGVSGGTGGRGPWTAGPLAHTHTRQQQHLRGKDRA